MLSHFTYLRTLTLVLGLALAGASLYLSLRHEREQIFQRYTSEIDALAGSLELELGHNIALLMSFRSLHEAVPQVDAEGFRIFSRNLREFNQGIYSMKWVPRVLQPEREAFERNKLQKRGGTYITAINGGGKSQVATVGDEYYPILLSEPAEHPELPIGYDLYSNMDTRFALETAAANNQAIGSPVLINQNGESHYAYLIALPIYRKVTKSDAERWQQLKGFVVGVFDIRALFDGVLNNASDWDKGSQLTLEDSSGQSSVQIHIAEQASQHVIHDERFTYNKKLTPIADLQWYLVGHPSADYFRAHRTLYPYLLGLGILLFSLMIEAYLSVLRRADKKLHDIALIDSLTGIANRRRFFEHLSREWPRALRFSRPLSVIIMDVDHFKKYNDTYGHVPGDHCLRDIAQILQRNINRPGDLLARYGGEEFAVLLPETKLEAARNLADKCRQAVQDAAIAHIGNPQYGCATVSMGVACVVPTKILRADQLIEMADAALYASKNTGLNCVSVYCQAAVEQPDALEA